MEQHSLLATKLYIPPTRPELVSRPRPIERLNECINRKLTLISAPAGYGKTTLISEWLAVYERPACPGRKLRPLRSWLVGPDNPTGLFVSGGSYLTG